MTPAHATADAAIEEGADLTGRQVTILSAIGQYYAATSEPCPARYIARRLSLHHSTIQEHLERLHRKGWLRSPHSPSVPSRRFQR